MVLAEIKTCKLDSLFLYFDLRLNELRLYDARNARPRPYLKDIYIPSTS